jgi:hypothetical protein
MLTAVVTNTTVNATSQSASSSVKLHAQLVTTDKSLKPMPVVQLPDAAQPPLTTPPRPSHTLQPPSLTPLQSLTSLQPHQRFALIEKVANVNTVNAGLMKKNHA